MSKELFGQVLRFVLVLLFSVFIYDVVVQFGVVGVFLIVLLIAVLVYMFLTGKVTGNKYKDYPTPDIAIGPTGESPKIKNESR